MLTNDEAGSTARGVITPVRVAAILLPIVTSAILAGFREEIPTAAAVLVLVLAVVAAAATGDRAAGLLAAVSAGAAFDFFLTEPYQRFTIEDPDDIQVAVLLVFIGVAVTELALWGHRQQARAARRSGYLEGVLGTARVVSAGDTPPEVVVDVVAHQIAEVLGADSCEFVAGPVRDSRIALLDHEGNLTRDEHDVDVERIGLPTNEHIALVVRRGTQPLGHFLVTSTTKVTYPTREQRRIAVLLADQVAPVVASG